MFPAPEELSNVLLNPGGVDAPLGDGDLLENPGGVDTLLNPGGVVGNCLLGELLPSLYGDLGSLDNLGD